MIAISEVEAIFKLWLGGIEMTYLYDLIRPVQFLFILCLDLLKFSVKTDLQRKYFFISISSTIYLR